MDRDARGEKGDQIRTFQRGCCRFSRCWRPCSRSIFLEPNLSMALLVGILAGVVLFAAGARIGHFLALAVAGAPLLFGAVASAQYRLARVVTFLNPGSAPAEATWQVHQSLVGIGAGRLLGVGIGQGEQKLGYLPMRTPISSSRRSARSGVHRHQRHPAPVRHLRVAGLPHRPLGIGPVRPAARRGAHRVDRDVRAAARGRDAGVVARDGVTLPFISFGRSSLFISLVVTGVLVSIARGRSARRRAV